jgi:(p)ppGpp synthase/HD superfamily hydrolase
LLATGQTVEIITAPGGRPNPAWLNFVVTAKARTNIRHYLKNLQHNEAIALGKRLLNRELEVFSTTYQDIDKKLLKTVLAEYKIETEEKLLVDIGLGDRMAPLIARKLVSDKQNKRTKKSNGKSSIPLTIKGTEGMVVSFPKCCYPIPGDPIHGFVTAGRGIVVHHQTCKNVALFLNHQEKWINVEWEKDIDREFQTSIRMNVTNQRGVLATVASAIADQDANIENVELGDQEDRYTTLTFVIEVKDRTHLAQVIRRVKSIKAVSQISRR